MVSGMLEGVCKVGVVLHKSCERLCSGVLSLVVCCNYLLFSIFLCLWWCDFLVGWKLISLSWSNELLFGCLCLCQWLKSFVFVVVDVLLSMYCVMLIVYVCVSLDRSIVF